MKKLLSLLLVSILVVGLVGCQVKEKTDTSVKTPVSQVENTPKDKEDVETIELKVEAPESKVDTPESKVESPESVIEVPFETATEIDQNALEVIENSKTERGYKLIKAETPGYYYIAVFAGEKPTAGYDIEISKIEIIDGKLIITAIESSPSPDSMNATVLTYPMDVVIVKDIEEDLDVEVVVEEVVVELLEGTYTGKIDNNSIEVKVGEEPLVLRWNQSSGEQLDSLNLKTDDAIRFEVYVNSSGQNIIKSIERIAE